MFKSIFSKMIIIFSVIIIVAFSIAGVALSFFLDSYMTDEKEKLLEEACIGVNKAFAFYVKNLDNPFAENILDESLNFYSGYTESIVWIVLQDGYVFKYSPEQLESVLGKYKDEKGKIKLPDQRQYQKVFTQGKVVTEIGDFFGFFSNLAFEDKNGSWLTVESPFKYNINNKETIIAVYFHTRVPELQKARYKVLRYFLISMAAAIMVSFILVYIFSLRLTKPLKQIKNAAKVIAGGEFKKRLDIKSKDEIGELARDFNQMAVALQNLEDMRRSFIANVSHELRTPMTSIRGFIQGILDGTIPEERQRYYLGVVSEETNRLNRLVNNLLDLARMEAGEIKMVIKPFDINELVRRNVIKFENQLLEKNIMVEASFEEDALYVNGDSDAIERVVYNLLHNAIKFTPQAGRITVAVEQSREKAVVSIEDTGCGIDREELDAIWDRFYKSDKSRGIDRTGTGLGLAIVRNIINEHGQKIWVESEVGKGTKFTFTLELTGKIKESGGEL